MGQSTLIAWTDHSFNIAWGCVKISPGCKNCYADAQSARFGFDIWGAKKPRRTFGDYHWREPLRWNEQAIEAGQRRRVFCSSMCDVFEDHPTIAGELARLWPLIRATPALDWQLLTKRADRIAANLPADWGDGWPNVWLGVSIENNDFVGRADHLRRIPATVRFISYEPALGPLDRLNLYRIDWLIYGGESGRGFRAEDKKWARDIRARCDAGGVAFFHKQSSGMRTESGIELDGQIVRDYPRPRLPTLMPATEAQGLFASAPGGPPADRVSGGGPW
ncbi:MAG TPA: DUF5131 family protein [Humisphaera sp.]|jgi:protein gp37|nr:DUF5131 family protein [Humisphaera sp.]